MDLIYIGVCFVQSKYFYSSLTLTMTLTAFDSDRTNRRNQRKKHRQTFRQVSTKIALIKHNFQAE